MSRRSPRNPAPAAAAAPDDPAPRADALLAGASGLVGRELARQWDGPGTLHLLARRALPAGPGQQVHVVDFSALPRLPASVEAYCCLGTTIAAAGSPRAFRAVDFDAVLAFARAARRAGVTRLAVVSALGANPQGLGLYSRVKGEAEAALRDLGFASLVIARPSLLAGDRASLGQPARPAEALALRLAAPLAPLLPRGWRPIDAAVVARAMRRALRQAVPGVRVIESGELQAIGA